MSVDKFVIPFEKLRVGIQDSRSLLPKFREIFYALKPEVDELENFINSTEQVLENPPPVTIALLGSTGAGKSTLINRLVGADVLPNSGSKVCTAGITRLKYLDSDDFKITVTFSDLNSWEQELKTLDAIETDVTADEEQLGDAKKDSGKSQISREERERFIAVYGIAAFDNFVKTRNKNQLVLPPKVLDAFNQKTITLTAKDSKEVLNIAKSYLVTTTSENEELVNDQLWPIVETVLIEGRFEAIKHGSEIVDLPGLNDPNPAREAKTFEFLKIAKFIFIAYEAKRQPTKDIRDVLKSRDLMSAVIASGKTHALTFIATKIDDFSEDDQDFSQFSEDDSMEILALHRKKLVSSKLSAALLEIAEEVSEGAESATEKASLVDAITGSKSFVTSALDFSILTKRQQGVQPKRTLPKFEHLADTEIPALREHVNELTLRVGPEVVFRRIHSDVSAIANQMQLILNLEFAKFIMQNRAFTEKSKALQERITGITNELDAALKFLSTDFEAAIVDKSEDFFLRIGKGVNAAPRIQREINNIMRGLHWMTARATTSRGGRFYSNSRGYIDMVAEVATPIIETITHPWSSFFGKSLQDILEALQIHLAKDVEDFVIKVRHSVDSGIETDAVELIIQELLRSVDEVSQDRILLAKAQLGTEVENTRSSLIELIRDCVENELTPVFYRASEETGSGMKMRMTDSIVNAVGEVVPKAFENAHNEIKLVVDASMKRVKKLIQEMTQVIIKDARKVESIFARIENTEKLFDDEMAKSLDKLVKSISQSISGIQLEVEALNEIQVISERKPVLILDGSNVATETGVDRRKVAKLKTLLSCKRAIENEYPGHELIIFVDATFKFALETQDLPQFEEMERNKVLTRTPGGVEADSVILKTAKKNNAKIITSDRYRDWVKSYPIISEPGRIIAPTHISATDQWVFQPRTRI
jgi:hypothetical protein